MNVILKVILQIVSIVVRICVCMPLAILEHVLEWFARGCDILSNMCFRGQRNVSKMVPMPWMVDLIKATEADSDRRRQALLKQLGE